MASNRSVDAHRRRRVAKVPLKLAELLIELLAHAVEALELEFSLARECPHLTDRIRIVRREGRIDDIVGREQLLRAGEIGNVGRNLACEYRVVGEAADLRSLDLGIPIGAFDQAAHDLATVRPSSLDDPVAQGRGAFLIALDRDPEAAPTVREQLVVGKQRFEHVDLELEPVRLFGVDCEMDVSLRSLECQLTNKRNDPLQSFLGTRIFEARMEGGQLH